MGRKLILAVLTFCLCTTLYSQKSAYHNGYFIDNKDRKVVCLIKNEDWEYTPTEFKYKAQENSDSQTILVADFKEFAVDEYKFKKLKVKIDKSSDRFEKASEIKASNFVEDLLLLRTLVEGKAVLYAYKNEDYQRFFYSKDEVVMPLTYKIYQDKETKNYRKNESYKQELLNALKCDKISENDFTQLHYTADKLMPLFSKYNNCFGSSTVEYKEKRTIKTLELFGKAGISMSRFGFSESGDTKDFGLKTKAKLALEAELNLSNKAKMWSILVEPSYQYYKSTYDEGTSNLTLDYKAIDLSLGLRKYFVVNNQTYLFVNGYATFAIPLGTGKFEDLDIGNTTNPALGIGCLYAKKYSLEIRYEFSRDLLASYSSVRSEYKSIGLAFGYKLL